MTKFVICRLNVECGLSEILISCLIHFQTERAYQKQPIIFQNKKRVLVVEGVKEGKEKIPRYHKSVGLGFKTPREVRD